MECNGVMDYWNGMLEQVTCQKPIDDAVQPWFNNIFYDVNTPANLAIHIKVVQAGAVNLSNLS